MNMYRLVYPDKTFDDIEASDVGILNGGAVLFVDENKEMICMIAPDVWQAVVRLPEEVVDAIHTIESTRSSLDSEGGPTGTSELQDNNAD